LKRSLAQERGGGAENGDPR